MAAYSVGQRTRDSVSGSTVTLLSETVTTAVAAATTTAVDVDPAMKSLVLQCNFTYGSGGTSAIYRVQTTFDGTTWVDIAAFDHATASLRRVVNLSGRTPVTSIYTATDGTLTADTVKDGLIGTQLRIKRTTVGTYAGGTTVVITALMRP